MGLFGGTKIDGIELQKCLEYFEQETKVVTFQTKEADLHNNTMVKYGNSIADNSLAASEAVKSARRLSQSANELIRRHQNIKNVPSAASPASYAWDITLSSYLAWASANAAAIEAMANHMSPNWTYVQQLANENQKARKKANDEDLKFLKRLKVNTDEIAKIIARATSLNSIESWEP
jgi:hypothetical protein